MTVSRVSGSTRAGRLNTRETVLGDTPAARAMSMMEIRAARAPVDGMTMAVL